MHSTHKRHSATFSCSGGRALPTTYNTHIHIYKMLLGLHFCLRSSEKTQGNNISPLHVQTCMSSAIVLYACLENAYELRALLFDMRMTILCCSTFVSLDDVWTDFYIGTTR